jgi:hypothetical protein
MLGHRPDVAVRPARGDDQPVGEGASSTQVDEDDVLRLVVVQAAQDQRLQRRAALLGREAGALVVFGGRGGGVERARREIWGQRKLLRWKDGPVST